MTRKRNLLECLFGGESAGGDDKENVEYSRADDGADANVVLGDEHADDGGEQLGSRTTSCHKSGARHIRRHPKLSKIQTLAQKKLYQKKKVGITC